MITGALLVVLACLGITALALLRGDNWWGDQ